MSLRNTARALPAMMKVGFAEAVAYRAEMLVWMLSTTMPLVMLALWSAVAAEAPVGRFGQAEFTTYYLLMFIVRQLTGAWAAWQMNYEVRTGALSKRLLRPISPVASYAVENLSALPMRSMVAVPMAVWAPALTTAASLSSFSCAALNTARSFESDMICETLNAVRRTTPTVARMMAIETRRSL